MGSRLAEEATYEIRIRGRLDEHWSDWLDNVTIAIGGEEEEGDITILTGRFDQAGLRGLLTRIWDLNLAVVSVGLLHQSSDGRLRRDLEPAETVCFSDSTDAETAHTFSDPHRFCGSTVAAICLSIAAAVVLALTTTLVDFV